MAPKVPAPLYKEGERVFCFHGPMLYEAKIQVVGSPTKERSKDGEQMYRVHYKGWKATWDDTVVESRIKPINEETIAERNALKEELDPAPKHKPTKASTSSATTNKARKSTGGAVNSDRDSEARSSGVGGRKRGHDALESQLQQEEHFLARPTLPLPIPEPLKSLLVDDWENITKNLQLIPLPHPRATVSALLTDWQAREEAKRVNPTDRQILEEVIKGLEEYFNRCLGRILLYRLERQQWLEVLGSMESTAETSTVPASKKKKTAKEGAEAAIDPTQFAGKTPSQIYGAEHLTRLLVTLPELIAQTNMDQAAVGRLRDEVQGLAGWLSKERERFFVKEYENAGQGYLARVKGGY
ncbi:MAG: hypothetical protein Q9162_000958 [Coniocarpon cinnabarinum]